MCLGGGGGGVCVPNRTTGSSFMAAVAQAPTRPHMQGVETRRRSRRIADEALHARETSPPRSGRRHVHRAATAAATPVEGGPTADHAADPGGRQPMFPSPSPRAPGADATATAATTTTSSYAAVQRSSSVSSADSATAADVADHPMSSCDEVKVPVRPSDDCGGIAADAHRRGVVRPHPLRRGDANR